MFKGFKEYNKNMKRSFQKGFKHIIIIISHISKNRKYFLLNKRI